MTQEDFERRLGLVIAAMHRLGAERVTFNQTWNEGEDDTDEETVYGTTQRGALINIHQVALARVAREPGTTGLAYVRMNKAMKALSGHLDTGLISRTLEAAATTFTVFANGHWTHYARTYNDSGDISASEYRSSDHTEEEQIYGE